MQLSPCEFIFGVIPLGQHPNIVPAQPPIGFSGIGVGTGGGGGRNPGQFVPKKLIFEFTPSGQHP